ncbi:hypothetical protein B0A89_01105 [Paracoccus contaminans]|uniref:Uncharacterized protein n=1 Tax=Paracoccus contaminans TaxID=1945662 RepID=A0A1W6CUA3_9RHOB|nr:hypothetical protein B0A89_01105 [Paracoccus contaminans]
MRGASLFTILARADVPGADVAAPELDGNGPAARARPLIGLLPLLITGRGRSLRFIAWHAGRRWPARQRVFSRASSGFERPARI